MRIEFLRLKKGKHEKDGYKCKTKKMRDPGKIELRSWKQEDKNNDLVQKNEKWERE